MPLLHEAIRLLKRGKTGLRVGERVIETHEKRRNRERQLNLDQMIWKGLRKRERDMERRSEFLSGIIGGRGEGRKEQDRKRERRRKYRLGNQKEAHRNAM